MFVGSNPIVSVDDLLFEDVMQLTKVTVNISVVLAEEDVEKRLIENDPSLMALIARAVQKDISEVGTDAGSIQSSPIDILEEIPLGYANMYPWSSNNNIRATCASIVKFG